MTSQPGLQAIEIHILPNNISQSKGKQAMKFGQQNITRETVFFRNYAENVHGNYNVGKNISNSINKIPINPINKNKQN